LLYILKERTLGLLLGEIKAMEKINSKYRVRLEKVMGWGGLIIGSIFIALTLIEVSIKGQTNLFLVYLILSIFSLVEGSLSFFTAYYLVPKEKEERELNQVLLKYDLDTLRVAIRNQSEDKSLQNGEKKSRVHYSKDDEAL